MSWTNRNNRQIANWLFFVCAMIFCMVIVGGVTRLTESGLSIVDWRPVAGILPPLSEAAWLKEFEAYKQYPEYQKVNHGMSLDEFKNIFYWEYSHRLLGRLIGIVFFIPFVLFLVKGKVSGSLQPKLWAMLVLGGLQGLLGWWMVKSGLVDHPDVSHYRLTAHLGLAVLIYLYIFWVASGLVMSRCEATRPRPIGPLRVLIGLIFLQILLGGLVAGLNAGMIYNSWPMMEGRFIPADVYGMTPWYMSAFEDIMTVQFNHRMLAYVITLLGLYVWYRLRQDNHIVVRIAGYLMLFSLLGQVMLGILTLIHVVPIPLAALHQAGALVTLSAALYALRRAKG
ncbi:COX15/CtaA family protein [Paremcibacter congregatus]|uniref:COX15/CtaA family protein n=1 Tax=Paremcibacter congregatus TaxID=2043170 RepID=UPI003A8DE9A5